LYSLPVLPSARGVIPSYWASFGLYHVFYCHFILISH
jgi:hypothetical protein